MNYSIFGLHCIASNYRKIWHHNKRMRWLVLYIIGGVSEQNSIVKTAIIARNVM